MAATASDVKALRDRTGAGMMDCKRALEESGGDVEKAIEVLRVKGQASAQKRAGRAATPAPPAQAGGAVAGAG